MNELSGIRKDISEYRREVRENERRFSEVEKDVAVTKTKMGTLVATISFVITALVNAAIAGVSYLFPRGG